MKTYPVKKLDEVTRAAKGYLGDIIQDLRWDIEDGFDVHPHRLLLGWLEGLAEQLDRDFPDKEGEQCTS